MPLPLPLSGLENNCFDCSDPLFFSVNVDLLNVKLAGHPDDHSLFSRALR